MDDPLRYKVVCSLDNGRLKMKQTKILFRGPSRNPEYKGATVNVYSELRGIKLLCTASKISIMCTCTENVSDLVQMSSLSHNI